MRPACTGILETCLYVEDVGRARAFYERVFGFPVMFEEPRICTLDAGPRQVLILFRRGATLSPIPVGGGFIPPHDASGPQHVAFAIPAEAYGDWKAHLAAEGVSIESEVAWPGGGRSIYFYDPDGLMVELATPGIWKNYWKRLSPGPNRPMLWATDAPALNPRDRTKDMANPRPRPAIMSLTERAAARVRELTEGADRPLAGVRVGIKKGGCAGMEYTLEPVETPAATDDVVTGHGATVYVDPRAILYLLGSVMDYETTKLRSGFVFQNPNEVSSCGCGESVMLKPAEATAG